MAYIQVFSGRPYLVRLWRHYRENRKFFNRRDAYRVATFLVRRHLT